MKLTSRAWKSGRDASALYNRLKGQHGVFYRSGGGERVVETGQYWRQVSRAPSWGPMRGHRCLGYHVLTSQGFEGHAFRLTSTDELPKMDVVMPEEEVSNRLLIPACGVNKGIVHAGRNLQA